MAKKKKEIKKEISSEPTFNVLLCKASDDEWCSVVHLKSINELGIFLRGIQTNYKHELIIDFDHTDIDDAKDYLSITEDISVMIHIYDDYVE